MAGCLHSSALVDGQGALVLLGWRAAHPRQAVMGLTDSGCTGPGNPSMAWEEHPEPSQMLLAAADAGQVGTCSCSTQALLPGPSAVQAPHSAEIGQVSYDHQARCRNSASRNRETAESVACSHCLTRCCSNHRSTHHRNTLRHSHRIHSPAPALAVVAVAGTCSEAAVLGVLEK